MRAARPRRRRAASDVFPFMRELVHERGDGQRVEVALEAKQMGYLRPTDTIVFNKDELLWTAIGEAFALHATGYRPPLKPLGFPVAGRTGVATIKAQLANMRDGGFISAHDFFISSGIADVMCGGDVEAGSLADEQWLIDLERKFFCSSSSTPSRRNESWE